MSTHVGRIVLTVNGIPLAQAKSVKERTRTGKKTLTGMSPTGKSIGTSDGTPVHTLDCEFYIPKTGELVRWHSLEGAVLTITPRDGIGPAVLFTGVYVEEVGGNFGEEGEATRSVTLGALDRIEIGT